jgi:hypothetical protein
MVDFKSGQEEEIEKLARTLKSSKLASSESEAKRMAEEMLGIGKKVSDDFKKRENNFYNEQNKSREQQIAQKQVEMLVSNLASGKSNVRIDMAEFKGLDVNKPLKDLISEEEEPVESDDDDAVEILPSREKSLPVEKNFDDSVWNKPLDDDDDEGSEEEKEDLKEKHEESESSEEDDSHEIDFSIKELDSAPVKSADERKREIDNMEESKIDLSSVFNANKR